MRKEQSMTRKEDVGYLTLRSMSHFFSVGCFQVKYQKRCKKVSDEVWLEPPKSNAACYYSLKFGFFLMSCTLWNSRLSLLWGHLNNLILSFFTKGFLGELLSTPFIPLPHTSVPLSLPLVQTHPHRGSTLCIFFFFFFKCTTSKAPHIKARLCQSAPKILAWECVA